MIVLSNAADLSARQLSEAVAEHGLYYAPDPSSQQACTIGGNVGTNAGGPHCLRHGVTLQHMADMFAAVTGVRMSIDEIRTAAGETAGCSGTPREPGSGQWARRPHPGPRQHDGPLLPVLPTRPGG